jgi:hypothetical protein
MSSRGECMIWTPDGVWYQYRDDRWKRRSKSAAEVARVTGSVTG